MSEEQVGQKLLVGWRERIDLPDWGIEGLRVKIDTGARTSALDVEDIEYLDSDRVRFHVILRKRPEVRRIEVVAELVRTTTVKPSSGQRQRRPVVRTRMRLGPVEREIELSLVCRRHMLLRMLLGRRGLGDDFVVDPEHTYIVSPKRPKSAKRKKKRRAKVTAS